MVLGGGLKKHVQTRWTTAFDCTDSIVRCQESIKNVSIYLLFSN